MNHITTKKAKIASVGTFIPSEIVTSDELMNEIDSQNRYDIPTDWMRVAMGIEERRIAPASAKPSDLAIPAAREAIDSCPGLAPEDIDLVIFCGIERDQPEPATAHTIQNALGLSANHAFDLANACFGFIDAMEVASNFIKCGIVRHALVVTGEVPSKVLRSVVKTLKEGVDIKTAKNMIGALSVGDAGGAVIISSSDDYEASGFELFNTTCHSSYVDKCIYNTDENGKVEGQMLMGHLAAAFIRYNNKLIEETLEKLGWDDFDWFLSHQIGKRPFEKLSGMRGVNPNSMIKTFDKLGNITTATFPVNFKKLCDDKEVKEGARIGGCFAGSGLAIGQFGYTF
ncbi:MAG: 3-oxoacyl-(acyl-carrier-protein) synthase III [Alteromonas macleodii]|jgi:3-oxoacyl-(acyl-carrier-protein) synthase III